MKCLKSSLTHLTLSLDPMPTSLLKQCLPTLTNIINISLVSGTFPDQFKSCSIIPLLKKCNLDKEDLSNDHIIKSMDKQKVTALCLLDLSVAFDTIDHSILLHHLSSWFGFDGTVISWFTSYLSSRSFVVSINSTSSVTSSLRQGVQQGSVLGPLLFILYTTPFRFLISDSSVGHHLFADDTQLFTSSGHLNSPPIFYTYKIQLILSLNGCLQIFSHSINLKLSFFLLAYLLNYLKSLILLF